MGNETLEFQEVTNDISVTVKPIFYPDASSKEQNIYVWIYKIRIENKSPFTVQLISRFWQIFDANGKLEEVRGAGVVGQQPILMPGQIFEYSSQVRLYTNSGLMLGEYLMVDKLSGHEITVKIPAFSLDINLENKKYS